MIDDLRFDVALSYCSDHSWIARDIYTLVSQKGFSVYCYDYDVDRAGGFIRDNLNMIYNDAKLNVMLWSKAYKDSERDSFIGQERHIIIDRHIHRGDDRSLIIVRVDDTPLTRDIDKILAVDIKKQTLIGVSNSVINRLKSIYSIIEFDADSYHPISTRSDRGSLHACTFTINNNYKCDPHNRWIRLADVLVNFPNSSGTKNVYLIPSGRANPLIRHSAILKSDKKFREYKRKATELFINQHLNETIDGLWFMMRLGDFEAVTIYSEEYDQFLNKCLMEFTANTSGDEE